VIVSLLSLALYQIALDCLGLRAFVAGFDMGGPLATLSWCFVLSFSASSVGVEVKKEHVNPWKFLLGGVVIVVEVGGFRIGVLDALGKNSLIIFILSSVVSTFVEVALPASTPVVYPVLITLCLLGGCIALAVVFARRGIYIKL